jgi:hypothetical protein
MGANLMSKKINNSEQNTPEIKKFCEDNGLNFEWKDQYNGHAVIWSSDVEIYVWVQRMACQIRKVNGHELSKPLMAQESFRFNAKWFGNLMKMNLVQPTKKADKKSNKESKHPALEPHYERGVTVLRIPRGTDEKVAREALQQQRNMANQHNRGYLAW